MEIHGIELKPGMVLSDDKNNSAVVIPHKAQGIAFMSYNRCRLWSFHLDNVLDGKLKEIRDISGGISLADGELLWKETKYRINDGIEIDGEQLRKEIMTYSGKEVRVRVI